VHSYKKFCRTFGCSSVVMAWIAPSAYEQHEFVSSAIVEMLAAYAVTLLSPGEKPTVVSPLGVVMVFKSEGLKDLADLAEKGDYAVSYDLMSGYFHVDLRQRSRTLVGFQWKGKYYTYNCLPFGLSTSPWVFSKVMRDLVIF